MMLGLCYVATKVLIRYKRGLEGYCLVPDRGRSSVGQPR
jgi:hypothetical protein